MKHGPTNFCRPGYRRTMSDLSDNPDKDAADVPDEGHVESRADLLPEERAAGSDAPREQAEVILEESAERTEQPAATAEESVQTSTPDERPDI